MLIVNAVEDEDHHKADEQCAAVFQQDASGVATEVVDSQGTRCTVNHYQ